MVAAVAPSWTVERIRPSEEGTEYVYFLTAMTPDGRGKVVLKACSGDVVSPTAARSEPRVLGLLADETWISPWSVTSSASATLDRLVARGRRGHPCGSGGFAQSG